ncbi:response regulator [Roseivivax sediminis]|uniref:Two-component system, chemotaxis family, response regulator CheY n=1 Tax=Roseivivax sediminis TaxID=936889 RepID=A0A1I1XMM0_9RHOB|nr:response regulator [Roseivivax sediminis]SFE08654.1 two-component system, chemotaxis family, response regulator CheY [Roseivivax sediminis]
MSLKNSLSVMVVDDMSTSRSLILMALEQIGITNIDFCKDGQTALQKIAAKPVHIVISDYNMPGLNGLQLLKALRENKQTSRIGFILVSGKLDKEILSTGKKLGLNNFITKPFDTPQMKNCLQAVVGPL